MLVPSQHRRVPRLDRVESSGSLGEVELLVLRGRMSQLSNAAAEPVEARCIGECERRSIQLAAGIASEFDLDLPDITRAERIAPEGIPAAYADIECHIQFGNSLLA